MEMFASDTVGLLDALDIESAHILGISMGGCIAQQIGISYPEKVRSLIIVSSIFGGPNVITADKRTLAMMFASPTETLSKDQAMAMRYSVAFSSQWLKDNQSLIQQIQEWRDQIPSPLYARGHQAAATAGFNAQNELSQITAPSLILHGDSDLIVPPKNSEMISAAIPSSRLKFIEGGHHLSFIEHHEEFNTAVMSFIDEVERK
jgi:pimeloyl-ACP methyl ester carboxylesterase